MKTLLKLAAVVLMMSAAPVMAADPAHMGTTGQKAMDAAGDAAAKMHADCIAAATKAGKDAAMAEAACAAPAADGAHEGHAE